jgi:hypothetical protein
MEMAEMSILSEQGANAIVEKALEHFAGNYN